MLVSLLHVQNTVLCFIRYIRSSYCLKELPNKSYFACMFVSLLILYFIVCCFLV
uniref:Uncharacterized protein n=1 Tax=Anguilla anguilla TaxID=7936 RepID=A0A0E9X3X7_ANGAN